MFTAQAVNEETLRDGNNTMAYLLDTLLYEVRVEAVEYLGKRMAKRATATVCNGCHKPDGPLGGMSWRERAAAVPLAFHASAGTGRSLGAAVR